MFRSSSVPGFLKGLEACRMLGNRLDSANPPSRSRWEFLALQFSRGSPALFRKRPRPDRKESKFQANSQISSPLVSFFPSSSGLFFFFCFPLLPLLLITLASIVYFHFLRSR